MSKTDILKKIFACGIAVCELFGSFSAIGYAEDENYYLKGNDSYLSLEAYDVEQAEPGSFYAEAEKGVLSDGIMNVIDDENASGGKGIAASGGISRPDGDEIEKVDARYRINVTEPGLYTVYVRMMTPASSQKSTHFAFDDEKYRRVDYSTTLGDYTWYTSSTQGITNVNYQSFSSAYLAKGTHVLNLKARQGGHVIDCILITKQAWTPMGFGSLPGEPYRYTKAELDELEYERSLSKLTIDGVKWLTDVYIQKQGGEFMVPMRNVLNMMGIDVKIRSEYYLASYNRSYLKVYINSDEAVANGREFKMSVSSYLWEDNVLMVPLSALLKAFDFKYTFDSSDNTVYITTNFSTDGSIRRESSDLLEYEAYMYGAKYKLKINRPNASVNVWLKRQTSSFYQGQWQEYTKAKFKGGWMGNSSSKINFFWGKLFPPEFENGYFDGDCGPLYRDSVYDMKVSVTDGDYNDTFIIESAIKTLPLDFREYVEDEDWLITNGELITIPTFENISYYIDAAESDSCEVLYRETGESEWKKAYKPVYDERVTGGQWRGSIVYLNEDTEYEVMAKIKKDGKVIKTAESKCRTWKTDVPIAKTVSISELYENGSYQPLVLRNICGTEDGYIKIVGDGKTVIDAGRDWNESVYVADCKYLILEGLKVKGGDKYGVNITWNCENVRLINCDVSEWGASGVLNPWLKSYLVDGNVRNLDGGVRIWGSKNIVVERCYIHDTMGSTNPWSYGDPTSFSDYWSRNHPAGPSAMLLGGSQGLVIRYNDMSGSDKHRFNDVMECEINGGNYAGPGFDSDIHGNLWYCNEDDSLEIDSSGRNVRVYENRSEQSLCGISTAPTNIGPLYIYRNLFVNRGSSDGTASFAVKIDDGEGMQFIFNNTMSTDIRSQGLFLHGLSRNNITAKSRNGGGGESETADYDIITGQDLKPTESYEPHGFFEQPEYINAENGDFRLKPGSLGIDCGETLDNFSSVANGKTDIGAFEEGGKYKFFPYRPIDMSSDKYYAAINNKGETTVTFNLGEIEEGLSYRIHTNLQNEFLTLEGVDCDLSGAAEPGKSYTVKIKGDLSNHYMWLHNEKQYLSQGNGMLYFRLSNGFSVPVTVCVKK